MKIKFFLLITPYRHYQFFIIKIIQDENQNSKKCLERLANLNQLVSFLATIGDFPNIRYFDPQNTKSLSYQFAQLVQKDLELLEKQDPDFPQKNEFPKSILLICDRSVDMIAPFLHEFTYQAMTFDLNSFDKKYNMAKYRDTPKDISSPQYFQMPPAALSLDENDSIWV